MKTNTNTETAARPALALRRHSIRDLSPTELQAARGGRKGQDTQSCSPRYSISNQ